MTPTDRRLISHSQEDAEKINVEEPSIKAMPGNVSASNSSSSLSASFYVDCQQFVASKALHTLYTAVIFLLTPLFILILYMGFQRRRRRHFSPMSNTDFFTYNMMIVEIFGVVGNALYTLGNFVLGNTLLMCGTLCGSVLLSGQSLFHLLTCVERYLAVVHPIAYMHLKEANRLRIRNISSILAWLLSFGWVLLSWRHYPDFPVKPVFSLLGVSLLVTLFCCVAVLRVLVDPGPGQEGRKKQHADQSKKRAFQMIVAITGTLVFRSLGILFWLGITNYDSFDVELLCVLIDLGFLLMVPSSLVLPVLFLHRAGKLSCNKAAQGAR